MRKLLLAVAAASALGVSLPAMAQDFDGRANTIHERIDNGVRDGSLTWYEARDLRNRLSSLERLEARYESDGLSGWESRDLDRRFNALSSAVYAQRHDNQYRYERRDYNGY